MASERSAHKRCSSRQTLSTDHVSFLGSMRGAEWFPVAEPPRKRMFGALKGKARTDAAFFEPLPARELDAWEK